MDAKTNRQFLRGDLWAQWSAFTTDQRQRKPHPTPQKPAPDEAPLIELVSPRDFSVGQMPLLEAMRRRKSHRQYRDTPLTLEELSFLLWAAQGVREVVFEGQITRRTVPSGGSRHPFETYLSIRNVTGLPVGLYRYLAVEHQLCQLSTDAALQDELARACCDFALASAVVFLWTAIPYRTEYRYGPVAAKLIAQDSGHMCQNLYLACEGIGAGTCAVGAYHQKELDELLGLDGEDEFVVYCAPVGKV